VVVVVVAVATAWTARWTLVDTIGEGNEWLYRILCAIDSLLEEQ
jgi:hypothetical protein